MQLPWPWQCWRSHDVESVLTEETKFFWLLGWKDEDRGERPSLVLFPKEAEFVFGPEETENVVITIHIIDTYCCYHHRNFSTMHVSYYCALWVTRARLERILKNFICLLKTHSPARLTGPNSRHVHRRSCCCWYTYCHQDRILAQRGSWGEGHRK